MRSTVACALCAELALTAAAIRAQEAKSAVASPAGTATSGKLTTQRESIPFPTHRQLTTKLRTGVSRTTRIGVNGEKEVVYRVELREDGSELRREAISTRVLRQAKPELVEEGAKQAPVVSSRGNLAYRGGYGERSVRVIEMRGTWYDPRNCGGSGSGRAATGIRAGFGVAAVDPRTIALGTRLLVEGYGFAVAADTGGAIRGNRIDLGVDSPKDVYRFNIPNWKRIRVHILN